MALTIPNSFTNGTSIDATKIQANNDAIKLFVNGNIAAGDLKSTNWCRTSNIMNGYYSAIINQFEFTTGLVQGGPELPRFHPGAVSIAIGDADSVLTTEGSGLTLVPRTCISFNLEADAKVRYKCTFEMFPLDDDTGTFSDISKSSLLMVTVDGVAQTRTKHIVQAMQDVGSGEGTGTYIPVYEGIRQFNTDITLSLTKGEHEIAIVAASNEQVTWVGRYSISLEAYY
jgi:hypothetical protein